MVKWLMRRITMLITLCLGLLIAALGHVGGNTPTDKPTIYSLHIRSDIAYRFATTKVLSRLANPAKNSTEALFKIQLPNTAFISNFSMVIDGKEYPGEVKEKEKARKAYEKAKKKGQSAGKVSAKPRNTNKFEVAVNVAAGKKVDFKLTYQELLQRRLSFYENIIYIDPGQLVRDFKVDIYINESKPLKNVYISPLKKDNEVIGSTKAVNPYAITRVDGTRAHIQYKPSYDQQKDKEASGLNGQLVLRYDVERDNDIGELQVVDGYFVHFFAPKGLKKGNKNVIFILDVSGSMHGTKLLQVKESMKTILDDLGRGDLFNILKFSSSTRYWKQTMQPVNERTRQAAVNYVSSMKADGGTNINDAIKDGINFLDKDASRLESASSLASIIVFLTDGDPTVGVTNGGQIQETIRLKNEGRYALYSLGFGANLDFKFLQKLSAQNKGFARKIFEDSDASLQLSSFYDEISSPLLKDVDFTYVDGKVDPTSLTKTQFTSLFDGAECVTAGKVSMTGIAANALTASVSAIGADGQVTYETNVRLNNGTAKQNSVGLRGFTERLWAYLTISELLDSMLATTNKTEEAMMKEKALNMSLKYNFVTPLTSMVVIKPDEPNKTASEMDGADSEAESADADGLGIVM